MQATIKLLTALAHGVLVVSPDYFKALVLTPARAEVKPSE